nr:LysE family transporter [Bacteriovorax sp. HI3]
MKEFLEGFILQASLIVALGSQNLYVIEMGVKRQYHYLVATICAVCDFVLIMLGVLGISALLSRVTELKIAIGLIGVGFLLYYSILKIKEAWSGGLIIKADKTELPSKKKVILMALGFTLLNPHVYMDTFFLIGGYSSKFNAEMQKILFGTGAGTFSIIWFFFLSIFSSFFSNQLKKEKFARGLALISGIILGILGLKLGLESFRTIIG